MAGHIPFQEMGRREKLEALTISISCDNLIMYTLFRIYPATTAPRQQQWKQWRQRMGLPQFETFLVHQPHLALLVLLAQASRCSGHILYAAFGCLRHHFSSQARACRARRDWYGLDEASCRLSICADSWCFIYRRYRTWTKYPDISDSFRPESCDEI